MLELSGQSISSTQRMGSVEPGQDHQAFRPLHEAPDSRVIENTLDQFAFPVVGHGAGGDLCEALSKSCLVGNLASAIDPSRTQPAGLAGLPQRD